MSSIADRRASPTTVPHDAFRRAWVAAEGWISLALVVTIGAGLLIRLSAARNLSFHVDEAASILAGWMVAEKGVPILPSHTLYLQGATLSYLLAPLRWLGIAGIDDLTIMRLPSVLAGTAAVYLAYRLGVAIVGSPLVGLFAAVALTVDPLSVRWSGMVRMYALLQCLSLLLIVLAVPVLVSPPTRRQLAWLVAVFWAAVFTHIAACLFLPAFALAALVIHGRRFSQSRRRLAAFGLCCLAPIALVALNALVTPPGRPVADALPGLSFVGDNLLSARQVLHPDASAWLGLFGESPSTRLLPLLLAAASVAIVARYVGIRTRRPPSPALTRLVALVVLYWVPVATVVAFSTNETARYLIHVHPLGLVLVLAAAYEVLICPVLSAQPLRDPIREAARVHLVPAQEGDAPAALRAPLARAWGVRTGAAVDAFLVSRAAFAAVVLLGAALRLYRLTHLSLWLDEGFTALYARLPWPTVLGFDGFFSPHPPLYFAVVKAAALIAPEDVAGRAVSAFAGIATLPVCYALVARLIDRRAALISTLVLALSPIHLYYAQEARMYALVVFLIAVSYLALVLFAEDQRWCWALAYAAAVALALYVDYSASFALLPQAIVLGMIVDRYRRRAWPILIAAGAAAVAYLPWGPQVLASVRAANRVERRDDYLGVDPSRVLSSLLSLAGISGDGAYVQSTTPLAWHRWPSLHGLLLLTLVPIVVGAAVVLRRRPLALVVVGCLVGTAAVAIWVSLLSPSYAERTVLTATLGWAVLVGAAFGRTAPRALHRLATVSLAVLLLVSALNVDALYTGAAKQRWRDAVDALALVAEFPLPVVSYSYGGVAETLVDVYEPDLLDAMRVITVRDGELEGILSNGVLPEAGITRQAVLEGRLADHLPASDPANDAIWYLYYQRDGLEDVTNGIRALGYERLLTRWFEAPRYQVYLDLYARPGTGIGTTLAADLGQFSSGAEGWQFPPDGVGVSTGTQGSELAITNQSADGRAAMWTASNVGAGIYDFGVEIKTELALSDADVILQCETESGEVLAVSRLSEVAEAQTASGWVPRRLAVLCPRGTAVLRVALSNVGVGTMYARSPSLSGASIP